VAISALSGAGFPELLEKIDQTLALDPVVDCDFSIPASDGAALHLLHERAKVLTKEYDGEWCRIHARAPASVRRLLARYDVKIVGM
jgi:50S ribosomal subunit-associated GTPase HflX